MPSVSPDRHSQNRPRRIDLKLSDGTCGTVNFNDTPDEGSVEISGKGITSLEMAIVEVYVADPTSDPTSPASLVAVTEVMTETR